MEREANVTPDAWRARELGCAVRGLVEHVTLLSLRSAACTGPAANNCQGEEQLWQGQGNWL